MPAPKITINDIVLTATDDVAWELRNGVEPVIKSFFGPRDELKKLQENIDSTLAPVTLRIEHDPSNAPRDSNGVIVGGQREVDEFEKLYVLEIAPGPDPFISEIVLADRRFWWTYKQIKGSFNLRRNVGFQRITAINVPELQPVVPDVWYAPFSTIDGEGITEWDPLSLLQEMLRRAFRAEQELIGFFPLPVILPSSDNAANILGRQGVSIESLDLNDRADRAVLRVLAYLPDVSLFITKRGDVRLHIRGDGAEVQVLAELGPEKADRGHVEFVNKRRQMPRSIDVLFTREVEVKFRFREDDDTEFSTRPTIDNRRICDNVLPNPVPDNASVGAIVIGGETITQGTYLRIGQFLFALPPPPGLGARLNRTFLRRAGVPFMDLYAAIELIGVESPNNDWATIVGALQRHYLRTFQINRRWMDRTLSLRAYRVGTVNPETGQRAPAEIYADYAVVTSQRWLWKNLNDDVSLEYAVNVDGFPPGGRLGPEARPAPAEISILDHDQGVWTANYLIDPLRLAQQLLPTKLASLNIPTGNMRDRTRSISYNSITAPGAELPALQANHELVMLLTLVPGAPNNVDQLQRVRIQPNDIQDLVTPEVFDSIVNGRGPAMEKIVGESIETARFRWLDDEAANIEALFGLGGVEDEDEEEGANPSDEPAEFQLPGGANDISDIVADLGLIVNLNTNNLPDGQKAASINEIARAVAAREYSRLVTRPQGSMAGELNLAIEPLGWIDAVIHLVSPTGELSTEVEFPEQLPTLDFLSLLPASVRAIILREAVRRKAT